MGKVSQREKKVSARKQKEDEKYLIVWEAIRRNPSYRNLYRKFHEAQKKKDDSTSKYLIRIYREFGIMNPIAPNKLSRSIKLDRLKDALAEYAIWMINKERQAVNESRGTHITVRLTIDLRKSATEISREFDRFIKSAQSRRARKGYDKLWLKEFGERQKVHGYELDVFDVYDKIERTKGGKSKAFTLLAKERLKHKPRINLRAVDAERKEIINTYNRAAWLIKGGFRTLV